MKKNATLIKEGFFFYVLIYKKRSLLKSPFSFYSIKFFKALLRVLMVF